MATVTPSTTPRTPDPPNHTETTPSTTHTPTPWTPSKAGDMRHRLEADGDRCLLVLDNAADPADLLPSLPAAGKARVLITSNERSVADLGAGVTVDVFSW